MAQTENLLSNAGFSTVVAITPQQQKHLMTLHPYKVTAVRRNGKTYYVYADPCHNQIYGLATNSRTINIGLAHDCRA